MSCLVLIQARMAATRLPGKMLLPLAGLPLIQWSLQRLAPLGTVVCCTSTNPADDPLAAALPGPVMRGSESDVLGRFLDAVQAFPAIDWLIRATGDNPLVLPELGQAALATAEQAGADYCSIEGSALGTTVELIRRTAFEQLAGLVTLPEEREHCTLGLLRRPEQFRIVRSQVPVEYSSTARLTIDTPEDFAYLSALIGDAPDPPIAWTWPRIAARIAALGPRDGQPQQLLPEIQQLKERAWLATSPTP